MFNLEAEVNKYYTPEISTDFNMANNICFNRDLFKSKMEHLDQIPDTELYELVKSSYRNILNHILERTDLSYLRAFCSTTFLTCLCNVLQYEKLSFEERICCNKLAYDYITLHEDQQDENIKGLLITLAKVANREIINILMCMHINDVLAAYIALARWSDTNENVNVKRLNFLIATQNVPANIIKSIYEYLFINSVQRLFTYTMFDTYNPQEEWVTPAFISTSNSISNVLLTMLEHSPMPVIKITLISYAGDFRLRYGSDINVVRLSLRSISGEFPRIRDTVDALYHEGIYIP